MGARELHFMIGLKYFQEDLMGLAEIVLSNHDPF
jgi:hypothetical protein